MVISREDGNVFFNERWKLLMQRMMMKGDNLKGLRDNSHAVWRRIEGQTDIVVREMSLSLTMSRRSAQNVGQQESRIVEVGEKKEFVN